MEPSQVFTPGVAPQTFFEEYLAELHKARLEQFERFSATPVSVAFRFVDTGLMFTVRFGLKGARITVGEAVDFPALTLEGHQTDWERIKALSLRLLEQIDQHTDRLAQQMRMSRADVQAFERFDGVLDLALTAQGHAPMRLRAILNHYEAQSDAPRLSLELDLATVEGLIAGHIAPGSAAGHWKVQGSMGFALDLGGFLLERVQTTAG